MELKLVPLEVPENGNLILGQSHFIKTAEDIYEAIVNTVPQMKFGVAFNEASGPCLTRVEGNDEGLKALAVSVLGENDTVRLQVQSTGEWKEVPREKWEIDEARKWAKKEYGLKTVAEVGYDLLPRGTVVPYAIKDAEWTFRLAQVLHPQILAIPGVCDLYTSEMALSTGALYSLERAGLKVRTDYLDAQIKAYRTKVLQHELDIEQIVGKPVRTGAIPPKERHQFFNPASNKELAEYFELAGFSYDSYDADTLKTMAHPMAAKLISYRSDKKLLETYFTALRAEVGDDGLYHPSIREHGTVSGRASSGANLAD